MATPEKMTLEALKENSWYAVSLPIPSDASKELLLEIIAIASCYQEFATDDATENYWWSDLDCPADLQAKITRCYERWNLAVTRLKAMGLYDDYGAWNTKQEHRRYLLMERLYRFHSFFYFLRSVIELRRIRFALVARCVRCRRWKSWRQRHNCMWASCESSGMWDPCIDELREENYIRDLRSDDPIVLRAWPWPNEGTDNPAELEILRVRAIEDAERGEGF